MLNINLDQRDRIEKVVYTSPESVWDMFNTKNQSLGGIADPRFDMEILLQRGYQPTLLSTTSMENYEGLVLCTTYIFTKTKSHI